MSPPWDVFGVGAAVGGAVGIYGGYQLRKLVVHIQDWKRDRALAKKRNEHKSKPYDERDVVESQPKELPPVIPIRRKRNTPQQRQQIPIINPDRDDVIAALMGSGYSKADAVKAVDACSLAERASGLEAWTRCAFTHAHKSKS